jgi:RNA polymerase sigma-70 factor (ECF subfamily)
MRLRPEEILRDHGDLVYRLIRRTVFDREAHADLFQEVFARVLASLPRFKGRSKLSTWIYSVTVRTCYDHIRRARRDRHQSLEEVLETAEQDLPDAESPFAASLASSRARALERALDQLPDRYRLPIHLFYIEELSYKEIARVLDAPIGTVKTNLYRGLRQLRGIMGGEINEFL